MNNDDKLEKEIRKVKIIVDQDKKYETHSWIMRIFRVPIITVLNLLPAKISRIIFLAFSGPNGDTRTVFRSVATHKALEVMYTYPERRKRKQTNISDDFWENFLSNARAVRNRLILVKKELTKVIKELSQRRDDIKLLSLGAGSARAVFEAIKNNSQSVYLKLMDMNQLAIDDSKKLMHDLNLDRGEIKIELHKDYIQNLENYCTNFYPDIIEMVGLLDYFPESQAIDLIKKIYNILAPGGYLITCNIVPNLESPFVTKGINWPLIYRQPDELAKLLIKGGFSSKNLKLKYEPLKIHCLAIAKK